MKLVANYLITMVKYVWYSIKRGVEVLMKNKGSIFTLIKRNLWYLLLLIMSTLYVLVHWSSIYQLKELNAINLIFILWIILLLLPLFSEMEFFGIKLKKELEKTKDELKGNINDLHTQITDLKLSNLNANTINFGSNFLPTEQELKELFEDFIKKSSTSTEQVTDPSPSAKDKVKIDDKYNLGLEVSEESTYLFKVRLILEKTLADLCEKMGYEGNRSISEMIRYLVRGELINSNTADLIFQINKIVNRGVHGEIVSNEYINFINKVFPELQKQLYDAHNHLHYYKCQRCQKSGYSRFENVCPNCGFVSED